jgi:hypothetical protein
MKAQNRIEITMARKLIKNEENQQRPKKAEKN